jgi:hypothetical protein
VDSVAVAVDLVVEALAAVEAEAGNLMNVNGKMFTFFYAKFDTIVL